MAKKLGFEARCNLGILSLEENNLEEALHQFRLARRSDPNKHTAYYYLGETCRRLGWLESAEALLNHAADLYATLHPSDTDETINAFDPDNPRSMPGKRSKYVIFFQSSLYASKGDWDRALSLLDELSLEKVATLKENEKESFELIKFARLRVARVQTNSKAEAFRCLHETMQKLMFTGEDLAPANK
ncbi:MAG: hypothetical protein PHV97_03195 [Candidatus Omnitrophica bacterium]|nr:hypothetical protein [Candidatus Omnitrophota bacterium]